MNRIGEKYTTTESYEIEIIEYFNSRNCTIKFTIDDFIVKNREYKDVQKGHIKYPYHPKVYGVGYFGEHVKKVITSKQKKQYLTWFEMMRRCYDKKFQDKHPSYIDCKVDPIWHNYSNFSEWFVENYNDEYMYNWHLDKDLLSDKKIYSPSTCCFVPGEINKLFIRQSKFKGKKIGTVYDNKRKKFQSSISKSGKIEFLGRFDNVEDAFHNYKLEKEKFIKILAEKYKDKISDTLYEKLVNYEVK